MSYYPVVAEFAAEYEQEHGHRPDEMVLQIADHIMKVRKMLTGWAKKDAMDGKNPYSDDAFQELAIKAFNMDQDKDCETVQAVAELWQSCYMDEYNTLRAGRGA